MIENIHCKLTYYNFVKQSKAKQSKAKQSKAKRELYFFNNYSKFYLSQFFNMVNLLVAFCNCININIFHLSLSTILKNILYKLYRLI